MSLKSRTVKELEDALEEANQRVFEVWKMISSNTRGNKYHDALGRFAEAPDNRLENNSPSVEEAFAKVPVSEAEQQKMFNMAQAFFGVKNVAIKAMTLPPGTPANAGLWYGIPVINYDPEQIFTEQAYASWKADRETVLKGGAPFNSAGYATTLNNARMMMVNHETAHIALGLYTNAQPTTQWLDPKNPSAGDKEWGKTVEAAVSEGWKYPTQYATTNYAELFAESAALTMSDDVHTAGNKKVDEFVFKVVRYGVSNSK